MLNQDKNNKKTEYVVHSNDTRPNDMTFECINHFIIPATTFVLALYFTIYLFGGDLGLKVPDFDVTADGLLCSLLVFVAASVCGRLLNHSDPKVKFILIILCTLCVTILQVFMTYIMVLTAVAPLLIAAQYSDKRALFLAFCLSIVSSFVIVFVGYKYGLCDANTVFAPLSRITEYQEMRCVVRPISAAWKDLIILFVLPRLILLSAFTMLIKTVVSKHNEILANEAIIETRSEHDPLTGLYNRVHYEKVLVSKYEASPSVLLIFFDINNLKFVNDTKGHDVGDQLIVKAAESIKIMRDPTVDAYRFGGDEFLAIVTDCTEADAEHYIAKWKNALEILNARDDGLPCEIAHGYSFGNGRDFSMILRQADMNMYNNKMESKKRRPVFVPEEPAT